MPLTSRALGIWSFLLCGVGLARRAEAPPSSLEACASLLKPLDPGQTKLSQVARAVASSNPHPKTDEACPTVSRHSQALKPSSHRNLRFTVGNLLETKATRCLIHEHCPTENSTTPQDITLCCTEYGVRQHDTNDLTILVLKCECDSDCHRNLEISDLLRLPHETVTTPDSCISP